MYTFDSELGCSSKNTSPQNRNLWWQLVMRIRLNYYPDPGSGNPPYKSGSGSKEKLLIKFNFSKFCGKNVITDMEKQLYIKLAKVSRGQLRSQKSCKVL